MPGYAGWQLTRADAQPCGQETKGRCSPTKTERYNQHHSGNCTVSPSTALLICGGDHVPVMGVAKRFLSSSLTVALAAYGVDCGNAATLEMAMQCCKAMRCHAHRGHSHQNEDGCKSKSQMRPALDQAWLTQWIRFLPVTQPVAPAASGTRFTKPTAYVVAGHSHDPPFSYPAPVLSLRI